MKFFFSNQVLDTDTRELSRQDMPVSLEPQVFDLVVHLMENRDRVVSKEELIEKIWHGRHVAESTLTSRINAARKAVGDSGAEQALIRTIARKGFRFVGRVQTQAENTVAAAPVVPFRDDSHHVRVRLSRFGQRALDRRITDRNRAERGEVQRGGGQEERLADVARFDQRRTIRAGVAIAPLAAGEDRGQKQDDAGLAIPTLFGLVDFHFLPRRAFPDAFEFVPVLVCMTRCIGWVGRFLV